MSAASFQDPKGVLVASCLSGRLSRDQQVGLTQALFKLLPLSWVLECVGFCVCYSLKAESLFPTAVQLWCSQPAQGPSPTPGSNPGLQTLAWALTSCSFGKASAVVVVLPFVYRLPRGGGLD